MKLRELFKRPFDLRLFALIMPTAMMASLFALLPLRSWDYWWHLTIGRLIDYWGRIPGANHFSYVLDAEIVVFNQPWAAQWMLFVLHDIGGIELVMFTRTLFVCVALFLITWIGARKTGSLPRAVLAALVAVPVLVFAVDLSPIFFVLPFWAMLIGVNLFVKARRRHHWLLLLFPLVTALWANLAPLFIAPSMAVAHWGIKMDKHNLSLQGATLASVYAGLLPPAGGQAIIDLVESALTLEAHVLSAAAALLAIASVPYIAAALPARFDDLLSRSPRPSLCVALTLAILGMSLATQPIYPGQHKIVSTLSPVATRVDAPLKGRVLPQVPVACTERLYRTGKQLRIFHPPNHAGYLLYRLQSPRPAPVVLNIPTLVTHDEPRLDLYALGTNPGVVRGLIHEHDINAVIVEHATHGGIIEFLESDPGWYVLIENDDHICFVRR